LPANTLETVLGESPVNSAICLIFNFPVIL